MKSALTPIALAAILLTGCSSPTAAPAPSATPVATTASPSQVATPTPTAKPAASRDDQVKALYLEKIRAAQPGLVPAEDAGMITIGQGFCKMYDGGAKGSDVNHYILTAAGWAYTVPQLVAMHGSAVGAFCPQYIDKMSL